ncbi:hypothetical protein AUK10_02060 [Candidatus Gracilibacteria bacterium CG2_30_37_12]|nr:MAG: hypothetical protein AUK10_02060 [Candidatus Gracilibacteria bacterium CG2_30_37_12]
MTNIKKPLTHETSEVVNSGVCGETMNENISMIQMKVTGNAYELLDPELEIKRKIQSYMENKRVYIESQFHPFFLT